MTASPAGGGLRALRAAVLALVALGLAATAHALAGGELPSPWTLAMAMGPLAAGAAVLTRRQLRTPSLLGWLATTQLLLHGFFAAGSPAGDANAVVAGHGHAGAAASMPLSGLPAAGPAPGSSDALALGHSGTGMLVAHVAAALLTALALSHGERVLWLLWEWVRPALVGEPVPVVTVSAPPRIAAAAAFPWLVALPTAAPRGPPLSLSCA